MNGFSWISLFKMSRDVILTALLVPTCEIIKSGPLFEIDLVLSVVSSTVPLLRNRTFTLRLFVISRSSLIRILLNPPRLELCLLVILH